MCSQKHLWQNQGWHQAALQSRTMNSGSVVCVQTYIYIYIYSVCVCVLQREVLMKATAAAQRGGSFTPLLRSNMAALSWWQEEPQRGRRGQWSGSAGTDGPCHCRVLNQVLRSDTPSPPDQGGVDADKFQMGYWITAAIKSQWINGFNMWTFTHL